MNASGTYELFKELLISHPELKSLFDSLDFHDYGPSFLDNYAKLVYKQKEGKDKNLNLNYSYAGQINPKTNKREGRGKCIYENGIVYEGIWNNDVFFGKGRLLDVRFDT